MKSRVNRADGEESNTHGRQKKLIHILVRKPEEIACKIYVWI
jgi:hypothetical protein